MIPIGIGFYQNSVSGVLWTPDDIVGFKRRWDPSDVSTITDSSGKVDVLAEVYGNTSENLVDNGRRPDTGIDTLNGLNVLTSTSNYLQVAAFPTPSSGDIAVFIVARVDNAQTTNSSILSMNSATVDWQLEATVGLPSFNGKINQAGNVNFNLTGGPFDGPSIYNVNYDWTNQIDNVYVDGINRGGDTYNTIQDTPQRFGVFINRGLNRYMGGVFGEVIVCEDVTTSTRQKIEGYLAHKWGTTANLDGGHPYKSSPPTV